MAIEQFVKHIENIHQQHSKFIDDQADKAQCGSIKSLHRLNDDLVKLKDLLKQFMENKYQSQ